MLAGMVSLIWACAKQEPEAAKMKRELQAAVSADAKPQGNLLMGFKEPVYSTKFGLSPNEKIDGKTIQQILTSQVAGRDDGQLCSACHNKNDAQGGYGVPVEKNGSNPGMKQTDLIYGRTWAGPDGWAQRFVKNSTKPDNVKAVIQAWINNQCK